MNIKNTKVAIFGIFALVAFVASAATTNAFTFTQSLRQGSRGAEVRELQKFLNMSADTQVATSGVGSPGNESTFFGPATRAAVIKFQLKNNIIASANAAGAGRFGPATRAAVNAMTAGTGTGSGTQNPATPVTGPVSVALAATNPASSTVVAGQATATIAQFAFSGNGVVTSVVLNRIGVSADDTLSNVYLFDGAVRLTDAATVSNNGVITFNNPAGIFSVAGAKTISVRSDIKTGTAGQTVGVRLASYATAAGTTTANISANIHSVAQATLATVGLSGTVTPTSATLNPGSAVTVWQANLNVAQRDVTMRRFAVRNVGSAPASAMANFKLFVNGAQVATAAGIDAMGYVTFDMTASPVMLQSGTRQVRVVADILSGASRTVNFQVRQAADADFVDSSFGVNLIPTSTPWAPAADNTISGVGGGSLTVERDVTSPSQNVTLNGNDVKLATFKLTAFGEPIRIENIRVSSDSSRGAVGSLRNGRVLIAGTQYGSTATIVEAGTTFTTNYTVMPGTPVMLDVHADIFDNDGTNDLVNNDTVTISLLAGTSNATRQDSLGTLNVPGATVSGNAVTVRSAAATLVASANYGNQSIVVPQTAPFKIGQWNLSGSSVEDINITTWTFDIETVTNTTFSHSDLTNLTVRLVDAGGNVIASPAPLATVNATGNSFFASYNLPRNANITVELWATIGSTITNGDSMRGELSISGNAVTSGQSVSVADVDGQTITAATGSITATRDASSPVAAIVTDNQTVDVANFKFEAVSAGYNVTAMTFTIANATAVNSIQLFDGATLVASRPGAETVVFDGLSWNIPANSSKILTAKLVLGNVGVGAGVSGASLVTTLTEATATSVATGISAAVTETNPASNAMYVYAATPTITNVALPSTILGTGTQTAARFTVAANGGSIAWKKMIFNVSRSIGGIDTLSNVRLFDNGVEVPGAVTFSGGIEADEGTAGTIIFVATNEQQVSTSKTYDLRVDVAGTVTAGNNMNVNIAQPSTYVAPAAYATVAGTTATFVWSDLSAQLHSETTTDWNNGFLVRNLPTDSQSLIRN